LLLALIAELPAMAQRAYDTDILRETFAYGEDTPRTVELDALLQGCPARDCIPSIDDPVFLAADRADFPTAGDFVIGVELNGIARTYPTAILDQHDYGARSPQLRCGARMLTCAVVVGSG